VGERLRLAEILTTGSAVANYLGAREVAAEHLDAGIDILLGAKTMEDLGRPQSPLVARVSGAGSGADDAVKALAQRWLVELGGDVQRELTEEQLVRLRGELTALRPDGRS
jgi:hypothetical protein